MRGYSYTPIAEQWAAFDPRKVGSFSVEVYRNLHRDKWSVRWDGRVVGHADGLTLQGCRLRVSEAGRQRVLASGRKNVHAWVSGVLVGDAELVGPWCDLRYDPRRFATFVDGAGAPVLDAALVTFAPCGRCSFVPYLDKSLV